LDGVKVVSRAFGRGRAMLTLRRLGVALIGQDEDLILGT
jgi:hypothetical protein